MAPLASDPERTAPDVCMLGTVAHSVTVRVFEREYGLMPGSGEAVLARLGIPLIQFGDEAPKLLLLALEGAIVWNYLPEYLREGLDLPKLLEIGNKIYGGMTEQNIIARLRGYRNRKGRYEVAQNAAVKVAARNVVEVG